MAKSLEPLFQEREKAQHETPLEQLILRFDLIPLACGIRFFTSKFLGVTACSLGVREKQC